MRIPVRRGRIPAHDDGPDLRPSTMSPHPTCARHACTREPLNECGELNHAMASISIEVDENLVLVLAGSLQPEVESPSSSRSRVSLEPSEGRLELRINASDVTALRAAVNSYLHWVDSILNLLDRID
jgi:tRNA threonylcarbamoyladenosine modification (KEOPS) complex  Pcc1 subunit